MIRQITESKAFLTESQQLWVLTFHAQPIKMKTVDTEYIKLKNDFNFAKLV